MPLHTARPPLTPANDHHDHNTRIALCVAKDLATLGDDIDLDELRQIYTHHAGHKAALTRAPGRQP